MQSTHSATRGRGSNQMSHISDASEPLRNAYNAAFDELELGWHWGVSQFQELQRHADERSRMLAYLSAQQPHLLKAYDVEFFVDAVQEAKAKYYRALEMTGSLAETQSP